MKLSRLALRTTSSSCASHAKPRRGCRKHEVPRGGRLTDLETARHLSSSLFLPNGDVEETDDPLIADTRSFYKVEKCTRDGAKVDSLLYAGNNLGKAQEIFAGNQTSPRIRLTIRQRNACCSNGASLNGQGVATNERQSSSCGILASYTPPKIPQNVCLRVA